MTRIRHHHVTVGEHRVHVADTGDPDGRPFLFLHGWPESWRAWESVLTLAGERARALAIDLPGVDPWDEFLRQPFLWHFAFHSVPDLPEHLVQGRQSEYFRYFYEVLAARPEAISEDARRDYTAAYASDQALAASFDWYRAFTRDAEENRQLAAGPPVTTPLLYLRGEKERGGDITGYAEGLRRAGITNLDYATVPGCGHFPHEEAPGLLWNLIAKFSG